MPLNESNVEDAALEWFWVLGYAGGTLTPTLFQGERKSYSEVVLVGRLREAIRRLNPAISFRTLAALRDSLLPKVLSGELSLPAALLSAQAGVAGLESKLAGTIVESATAQTRKPVL